MRDTYLGLNQKSALNLRNEFMLKNGNSSIGIEDLILIRRIGDFILSSKTITVIIGNECFHWVHYETIQNDLPLIFPTVLALKKRVEKLSTLNLLINKKYAVSKNDVIKGVFDKPGNYSVIKLSNRARELFDIPEKESIENTEKVTGLNPVGSKGYYPVGDKAYHPVGSNKEYLDTNTKKNNNKKIDTKDDNATSNEVSIDQSKVDFKNNFLEYLNIVSKATNTHLERIRLSLTPSTFSTLNIVEVLEEIKKSKFLRGEANKKPKLTNFTRINMIKKILAGEYADDEKEQVGEFKQTVYTEDEETAALLKKYLEGDTDE